MLMIAICVDFPPGMLRDFVIGVVGIMVALGLLWAGST